MFDFWTVLYLFVVGVIVGYLARLIVPGRDALGFWQTALLGVVGSFIGGFLGYVLFGFDADEGFVQPGGIVGSLIGAVIAVYAWRAISSRR